MLTRVLLVAVLVAAGVVAGVALHTVMTEGDTMFAGKHPANIGVKDGKLAPCARSPNCVSSQADPSDSIHYIAPISYGAAPVEAITAVRNAIESMPRTRIVRHDPDYLYAEFRSKLLGFVDDVEFFYDDKAGVVQVRSASRLGRRDFGVNRERIEAIRSILEGRLRT